MKNGIIMFRLYFMVNFVNNRKNIPVRTNFPADTSTRFLGLWVDTLRDSLTKKNCCSYGLCPNEGGVALPKFFVTFS